MYLISASFKYKIKFFEGILVYIFLILSFNVPRLFLYEKSNGNQIQNSHLDHVYELHDDIRPHYHPKNYKPVTCR